MSDCLGGSGRLPSFVQRTETAAKPGASGGSSGGSIAERRLAQIARAEARGKDPRLIDQAFSPLGRRAHIAAVRRRLSEHASGALLWPGAVIDGRRYLLTPESLAEELGRARARADGQKAGAP